RPDGAAARRAHAGEPVGGAAASLHALPARRAPPDGRGPALGGDHLPEARAGVPRLLVAGDPARRQPTPRDRAARRSAVLAPADPAARALPLRAGAAHDRERGGRPAARVLPTARLR